MPQLQLNVKTQILELVVPAGSNNTRFFFTDQPFLRTKKMVSIEAYNIDDIPVSPLNNELVDPDVMAGAFLTLYGNDPEVIPAPGQPPAQGEWIQYLPLISIHRIATGGGGAKFVYDLSQWVPRVITWEKSYITVPTAIAPEEAVAFLFNIGYIGVDNQVS